MEYLRVRHALESYPAVPTVDKTAKSVHHQCNYTYSENPTMIATMMIKKVGGTSGW